MIEIIIGKTSSEPNRINKTFTHTLTLNGTLKEETSVIEPVVMIETSTNIAGCNYAHIDNFGRFYFVTDITVVRTGLWRVSLRVDPLMTYKSAIRALDVVLADSRNNGDNYLSGSQWRAKVKSVTDILSFSGGLSDNGHYILITAGG